MTVVGVALGAVPTGSKVKATTSTTTATTATAPATIATPMIYGCVSQSTGKLRVIAPSTGGACKSSESALNWSQTGNTILNGSGSPTGSIGGFGDYYLDTTHHVLYGPATHPCLPLPCHTSWGNGVSLVGPRGPAGGGAIVASEQAAPTTFGWVALTGNVGKEVVGLTKIPAGSYLLLAKVTVGNADKSIQNAECELDAGTSPTSMEAVDSSDAYMPAQSAGVFQGQPFGNRETESLQGSWTFNGPGYATLSCGSDDGVALNGQIAAIQGTLAVQTQGGF